MCSPKMPKVNTAPPAAPPPPPEESATQFEPANESRYSMAGAKKKASGGNGLRIRLTGVQ